MIQVTRTIALADDEIRLNFVRASGPGGQNVNKVSTAVELRFNAAGSTAFSDETRERLFHLAGRRLTREGEIVLFADRFRTQERNRQDAIDRLVEMIRRAAHRPAIRKATKPTLASKKRRLDTKKQRGKIKAMRRPTATD
jgi:ribosome-associated protein